MTTHPPGWDRDRAVRAAAEAIERKLLTEPPAGHMTWLEADEELAAAALEAALPHLMPQLQRDLITAQERLRLARQALTGDGYFTPDQVGDDIAPRIMERIGYLTKRLEHAEAALAGDSEGCRLWMIDCGELVAMHRERAKKAATAERERIARLAEERHAHYWQRVASTDDPPEPYLAEVPFADLIRSGETGTA